MMSTTDTTAAPLEVLQQAAGAATAVAAAVSTSAIAKPPGMEELLEVYNKNFWWNVIYLSILTILFTHCTQNS